ncbi:MAG: hypothetical protein ACXACT_12885 [Candidatus Thorarchaeota archaeon]
MVPSHCVMVKGPCRGVFCDFWGRVKIRKSSVEELAAGIRQVIMMCDSQDAMTRENALREYWHVLGIRNMERLCEEEPELCAKMTEAELQAQI